MRRSSPLPHLVLALCSSTPFVSYAEPPSVAERTLAREEFARGVEAARAGRWEDAHTSFGLAYSLTQDIRILLNLGAAQTKTGRLLEAQESYRVLLAKSEPEWLVEHEPQVRELMTKLEASLPRLVIRVEGLLGHDEVRLDEKPLSRAALGLAIPVNPGAHVVAVWRDGHELVSDRATLSDAAPVTLVVKVPSAQALAPPAHAVEEPAVREEPAGWTQSPWFWVGIGVGVAAAAATIGAVALTQDGPSYPGSTGVVLMGLSL